MSHIFFGGESESFSGANICEKFENCYETVEKFHDINSKHLSKVSEFG